MIYGFTALAVIASVIGITIVLRSCLDFRVKAVVSAVCIICIIASAVSCFLFIKKGGTGKPSGSTGDVYIPADGTVTDEMRERYPYIGDVIYKGPFEDMDVYKWAFEKTDAYLKNKDIEEKPDKDRVILTAKDFISSLYGGGYREIVDDPDKYRENILSFIDEKGAFLVPDTFSVSGNGSVVSGGAYAEMMSDYIVEHELNAESEFITDESLVYNDRAAWVRGIIKTRISNIRDGGDITKGEYRQMIDVAMILWPKKKYGYQIIYVRPVPFGDGKPFTYDDHGNSADSTEKE